MIEIVLILILGGAYLAISRKRFHALLKAKERELASREWENQILRDAGAGMYSDPLFSELVSQADPSNSIEFYQRVLSFVTKRFRMQACAALFTDASQQGGLTLVSTGLVGRRFENFIRGAFQSYFETGARTVFGFHDQSVHTGGNLDFSTFGCRFTLSAPLENQQGRRLGVLWLGFATSQPPTILEQQWLPELMERVATELQRREELTKYSQRAQQAETHESTKDEFIAQMSHDLRSPLNNVKSILTLLKVENPSAADLELLESGLANCDELSELVEDVLDFSKHRAGKLSARPEVCDLRAVIETLLQSYSAAARRKGLEIGFDCQVDSAVNIKVDRTHLRRVFHNLFSNALKYTSRGSILAGLRVAENGEAIVSIRDSGVGMDETEVRALFTPFTRFNSGQAEGVGLGLAITKILVEQNGGTIGVTSKPRVGTEFEVRFSTVTESAPLTKTNPIVSSAPISVLLVDDDFEGALSMARLLCLEGLTVETASSVDDALSVMNFDPPDYVITDLSMPGGGGKRVLDFAASRPIKVIVLSGSANENVVKEALALGALKVLQKPCELDELLAVLRSQLSKSPLSDSSNQACHNLTS